MNETPAQGTTPLLEPCPFCGGEDSEVQNISGWWRLLCGNCGARTVGLSTKEDAIAAWNERAPDADRQRLIAEATTWREQVEDDTVQLNRLAIEADKLRAELAESKALIAYMDKWVPLADDACAEPGITYSEACKRTMRRNDE